ncbi:MAG: hypothetical protein ABSF70_12375 [Terracidiphilus sp.]
MSVLAYSSANSRYNLFLLLVAGLGGLLNAIDVGINRGALPYLAIFTRSRKSVPSSARLR